MAVPAAAKWEVQFAEDLARATRQAPVLHKAQMAAPVPRQRPITALVAVVAHLLWAQTELAQLAALVALVRHRQFLAVLLLMQAVAEQVLITVEPLEVAVLVAVALAHLLAAQFI